MPRSHFSAQPTLPRFAQPAIRVVKVLASGLMDATFMPSNTSDTLRMSPASAHALNTSRKRASSGTMPASSMALSQYKADWQSPSRHRAPMTNS
eukprot:CAMPEP_0195115452 /NCGR_PEP_ID=MMETSP0448-20130528/109035_1 /TAXON_ID=66468 /ORGANISM="Heterocapsa triquestra, Strain CCMP 448" /LENGTH=93 /DNA_ID=CAMNT_0040152555 /DNA_START=234 /DNA_END=515 /DNA_ORIENTATION=-